ncbi:MAG TPA: hypothetical protein VGU72_09685 [Beijerinckiaceae bacterium]|jgi:putative heme iron utilization protein|nr:hypothetical protein [Beijerinckiaceae bacterium]
MTRSLKNPKHERFAQELAKGIDPTEAYANAGFVPNRANAHRLMASDDVRARVAAIQDRSAIRAEVTAASLIEQAEEVRVRAMAAGQYGAAIRAIREKGILAGIRVEKRQNTHRTADNYTDDELAAFITDDAAMH